MARQGTYPLSAHPHPRLDEQTFHGPSSDAVLPKLPSNRVSRRSRSTRTPVKPVSEWSLHKAQIHHLYIVEDRTLNEVMEIMARQYNFKATRTQYQPKLHEWGFKKNVKRTEKPETAEKGLQLHRPPPDDRQLSVPCNREGFNLAHERQYPSSTDDTAIRFGAVAANVSIPLEKILQPSSTTPPPMMSANVEQGYQLKVSPEHGQLQNISHAQQAPGIIESFYFREYQALEERPKADLLNLLQNMPGCEAQGAGIADIDYALVACHVHRLTQRMSTVMISLLPLPECRDLSNVDTANFYRVLEHLAESRVTDFAATIDRFLILPGIGDPLRSIGKGFRPLRDLIFMRSEIRDFQVDILSQLTQLWRAPDVRSGVILGYSLAARQNLVHAVNNRVDLYLRLSVYVTDIVDALETFLKHRISSNTAQCCLSRTQYDWLTTLINPELRNSPTIVPMIINALNH